MKNLNEVAKELNEVMGLTPPIKTVAVKKDVLLAGIKEAAEQIDPEQDEFTDETIEALKELNLWPGKEEEEEVIEEKPKLKVSKVKPEPEPEEDDEPEIAVDKKPKKDSPKTPYSQNRSYNKNQAFFDVMKKVGTKGIAKKDLYKAVDDMYVQNGGTSNLSGTTAGVNISLPILKLFGAVTEKNDKIYLG